jgi:hypothetical protein
MQRIAFLFISIIFLIAAGIVANSSPISLTQVTASATPEPGAVILSPFPGQALQGLVPIKGNTAENGFTSAELEFSYTHDPTHTWFLINETDQSVTNGLLAQWDTTTLTDEIYDLRLTVLLNDGRRDSITVSGLRVRNYSPIETDTPTPVTPTSTTVPGDTPVPTKTPTPTVTPVPPTFTPLPPNPAQLSTQDITSSLGKGALVMLGMFAMMAIYYLVSLARKKG